MLVIRKEKESLSTHPTTTSNDEYRSVPITALVESPTNPRKHFDEDRLRELAESIRTKGLLSPLLVRPVEGHFEIVAGARRYRAARQAGLNEVAVCVRELSDSEAQELQTVDNLQRADLHPFEEAHGFAALVRGETGKYSIEELAAHIAKPAAYVAKRLKLLDLTERVAEAFRAARIGIEHALVIAKLPADAQENALDHCFDGYFAGNEDERSLVPVSRLAAWVEQNVYLRLRSVPFSKDDATLLPEAGSCTSPRW
jgi:ParB family transcriptional regulator, chromosome partitioning protein